MTFRGCNRASPSHEKFSLDLEVKVWTRVPASLLRGHPDVTFVLDELAAADLKPMVTNS
jgi:hypothetical protein